MKKGIKMFLCGGITFALCSCSDVDTYADRLEDEQEAIEHFIKSNGLEVLNDFPADSTTSEKQFIKFSNGLYFHIFQRGNLNFRPTKKETLVCLRYKECEKLINFDASLYEGNWEAPHSGYEFVYGGCDREGWEYPLQFLGDGAEVALIVPSQLGTSVQQSDVIPFYYGRVRYKFQD